MTFRSSSFFDVVLGAFSGLTIILLRKRVLLKKGVLLRKRELAAYFNCDIAAV